MLLEFTDGLMKASKGSVIPLNTFLSKGWAGAVGAEGSFNWEREGLLLQLSLYWSAREAGQGGKSWELPSLIACIGIFCNPIKTRLLCAGITSGEHFPPFFSPPFQVYRTKRTLEFPKPPGSKYHTGIAIWDFSGNPAFLSVQYTHTEKKMGMGNCTPLHASLLLLGSQLFFPQQLSLLSVWVLPLLAWPGLPYIVESGLERWGWLLTP